ncbi:MAG TPA: hypothetical protein VNU68_21290 [Verrucomicrobiae bacterium]|nr:hypothetical protein [Verrucomicrobiae bacterium]
MKLPYCKRFYAVAYCKQLVEELTASGRYKRVWMTRPITEDGKQYARVWVERKEEETKPIVRVHAGGLSASLTAAEFAQCIIAAEKEKNQ